jgi:dTDP-4-dehydrorhamnose reductase
VKKPKILLTGKNGQVGWELQRLLPRIGDVVALGHQELDLADPSALRSALRELRPNLIVNAAAFTAVDLAESMPAVARAINAEAPAIMAEEAKRLGASLVHYSTDYVFNGENTFPYLETDPPNPINEYGRTKLAGEQAIQGLGHPYLIFRTEWVYATRGRNFLLTILRLATQREELRVVDDQVGAPTWSRMVALATTRILERISSRGQTFSRLAELSGLYHLTATGQTSWYGFAQAILEECSITEEPGPWLASATEGQRIACKRVFPVATKDYPTPSRRPAYSVLSNTKLGHTFGIELPDWRTQLHMSFRGADTDVPEGVLSIRSPSHD